MKKLWLIALISTLTLSCDANSAPNEIPAITGTAPSQDDARTNCVQVPLLVPRGGNLIHILFKYEGSSTWVDTLNTTYGSPFTQPKKTVVAGAWKVTVTAADSMWNANICPVVKNYTVKAPPAQPVVN